jgi:hypothetical protein
VSNTITEVSPFWSPEACGDEQSVMDTAPGAVGFAITDGKMHGSPAAFSAANSSSAFAK